METQMIELDNDDVIGYQIDLDHAPLLLIKARKGYIMCGYLDMKTANKLGDIAGKVTKVKTFEDVLRAPIVELSEKAKKKGFKIGMNASDFLNELTEE